MGTPIKSDELFSLWSNRQWKRIYLFAGVEDFLIEQAITQFTTHWLGSDTSGLNLDRFDAETHTAEDILQICQTVPFLGTARLVVVRHVSQFNAANQEKLADGFLKIPDNTALLLVWDKEWRRDDAKKVLVEAVSTTGQVVIFWPLFPENAQRWVLQRARHYQKTIHPEAAGWLVQHMGESLRVLDQELAKASLYVADKADIELEDVKASYGYEKASSPYEWLTSLRQKKTAQALKTLGHLLQEGEEPIYLLALVSGGLRDWLSAKSSQESTTALAMRFRLRKGEEFRFLQDLKNFSDDELMDGISACAEMDQRIKSGQETPETAITLLTLRLCGLQLSNALR